MGRNLLAHVEAHSRDTPDAVALIHCKGRDDVEQVTYRELYEHAEGLALAFEEVFFDAEIIPMYLAKSTASVAAMLGALGAGKAFAYLNQRLRGPQVSQVLCATKARAALIDPPGASILSLGEEPPARNLPSVRWWNPSRSTGESTNARFAKALEKFRKYAILDDLPVLDAKEYAMDPDIDRVGACLFTSGSTGEPKGVLIRHRDLLERARAEVHWFNLTRDDNLLSILPFSFDVGLNQLLSGLMAGATLVLIDSWLPADIAKRAKEHNVTGISGVPSIWIAMMRAGIAFEAGSAHASLRYITLSGGDLSESQLAGLENLAPGVGVYKTYGQTEAFRTSCLRPEEFKTRPASVGKAFSGVEIQVVREDGTPCRPMEEGHIVHYGLGTMMGYLGGKGEEEKLKVRPGAGEKGDADYAVYTGDIGYLDEEKYLFVKGRGDSMLKISGNRVYPREVVNQLILLEGVSGAEVLPIRTENDETRLIAFVTMEDGVDKTPQVIQREVAQRLPSYMVPTTVQVLDEFPLTVHGKTDGVALFAMAK